MIGTKYIPVFRRGRGHGLYPAAGLSVLAGRLRSLHPLLRRGLALSCIAAGVCRYSVGTYGLCTSRDWNQMRRRP